MITGISVECTVCRRTKAPHGRSVPDLRYDDYCTNDCSGYCNEPRPGCLWPGETSEQFGYEHCLNAIEDVAALKEEPNAR